MLVVDEQLDRRGVITALAGWYPGRVFPITALRPDTVIKDEAIPSLLLLVRQPTFVTINVSDFWRVIEPHRRFCVIAVGVRPEQIGELPQLIRTLLRLPAFATRAARMGKVVRISARAIEYYGADRQIHAQLWTGE